MSEEKETGNEPQNAPQSELQGITHEDIAAAVAILREDHVIKAGKESQAAVKALEERYLADRGKDEERWKRWEESQPKTPENDPEPTPPGTPVPPPPVPQDAPVGDGGTRKEKRKRGIWFAAGEDDDE